MSVHPAQVILRIKELQSMMIIMKDKFILDEVMLLVFEKPNDGI